MIGARSPARLLGMDRAPKLPGRPSRFRGKVRGRPVVITLTPEGHAALAAGRDRTRLTAADYIESLLRRDARAHAPSSDPRTSPLIPT